MRFSYYSQPLIVHVKLRISQSKFYGPRKYTLRYHWFDIKGIEIDVENVSQTMFFDVGGYFEITVYEISIFDCI